MAYNKTLENSNSDFDLLKTNIAQYIAEDMSEADTRSKVIDQIFIQVLGWEEKNIRREEKLNTGYYDYMFSTPESSFIVEAKRNYNDIKFPNNNNKSIKLGTLYKSNTEVFDQIRGYLQSKNLRFGVITNGRQYIIANFINITGKDWQENKAHVFRDLEDIQNRFLDFYNLLSFPSIIKDKLSSLDEDEDDETLTLLDHFSYKDKIVNRNVVSHQISSLILKVFGEFEKENLDEEFLQECYVENVDTHKYFKELEYTLIDNAPEIDERIVNAKNTKNMQDQIEEKINVNIPLIVIIGGKGAGKTSFLNNFFYVRFSGEKRNKYPVAYMDFRSYTKQEIEDTQGICRNIISELRVKHPKLRLDDFSVLNQIFSKEITSKKKGVWKYLDNENNELNKQIAKYIEEAERDSIVYLEKIIEYLKVHCQKNVCVVIDNADQLDSESQKKVYLFAQSIKSKMKCTVIVSLREGYYYKVKNNPPFDAYESVVYHISAPIFREVLEKRLQYAIKCIPKYDIKKIRFDNNGTGVEIYPDSFRLLFEALLNSFINSRNKDLLHFIELTSYPNTRLGMTNIKKFLLSAHTKIVDYIFGGKDFKIPIWEFVKSIALEGRSYYHHDESIVINLFYPVVKSKDHFFKIHILDFLLEKSNGEVKDDFFVRYNDLKKHFLELGYESDNIKLELECLHQSMLIDSNTRISDTEHSLELEDNLMYRITHSGQYYIEVLISEFYYLELVAQDTPIFDKLAYSAMQRIFPKTYSLSDLNLSQRCAFVEEFVTYLKGMEKKGIQYESKNNGKILSLVDVKIDNEKLKKNILRIKKIQSN